MAHGEAAPGLDGAPRRRGLRLKRVPSIRATRRRCAPPAPPLSLLAVTSRGARDRKDNLVTMVSSPGPGPDPGPCPPRALGGPRSRAGNLCQRASAPKECS